MYTYIYNLFLILLLTPGWYSRPNDVIENIQRHVLSILLYGGIFQKLIYIRVCRTFRIFCTMTYVGNFMARIFFQNYMIYSYI